MTTDSSVASSVVTAQGILDETLTPELRQKVFGNELVRDIILDYVLSPHNDTDNDTATKTMQNLRLVDHGWLDISTQRLQSSKQPQFYISFDCWGKPKDILDGLPIQFQVNKFIETWTFPGAGARVPTFELIFKSPVFDAIKKDQFEDVVKVLAHCGNGLQKLDLDISATLEAALQVNFSTDLIANMNQMDFPVLNDLEVCLPEKQNTIAITLLRQTFLACRRVKRLHLRSKNDGLWTILVTDQGNQPNNEFLPARLEKLESYLPMTAELTSSLLLLTSLQYLTTIIICVKSEGANIVVSQIAKQFPNQLTELSVTAVFEPTNHDGSELELQSTVIQFPVMKKLKQLELCYFHSEHAPGPYQLFPVLETLSLKNQSTSTMLKWTQNFKFNSLKHLTVDLCIQEFSNADDFSLQLSQQFQLCFSVVTKLILNVRGDCQDAAFKNIFQHMTQLHELRIEVNITDRDVGPAIWDSILLGISTNHAIELAASKRSIWGSTNLDLMRNSQNSITNLKELTTFSLSTLLPWRKERDWLISDVSFYFAFFRMKNLKQLELKGRFKPSKAMVQEWRLMGRQIGIPGHPVSQEDYIRIIRRGIHL